VTAHDPDSIALVPASAAGASPVAPTAGALLRGAREAAGLSLEAVAQQLKLASRQVTALEEDDFARLPGRTFVRGFVRNYARLVRIDAETVLAALSGTDAASLDSPALQPTAPTIGELPTGEHAKPGWTRWAIPLTLVAVIATAAVYEFSRGYGDAHRAPGTSRGDAEPTRDATPPPGPMAAIAPDTPLVNPMAPASSPNPTAVIEPAGGTAGRASTAAPVSAGTAPPGAQVAGDVTLVLTYRDSSWTEVKDAGGRMLVSQMLAAGQVRSVSGTPPFELTIGNAAGVSLAVRGKAVDLAPHTRQNVARLVLE
jgi:cytoskeleton protein RodZ